jgi:hypothetical protein
MTDIMDEMSRPQTAHGARPLLSRLMPAVLISWLAISGVMALAFLPMSTDLIGPDNDDVMRLVKIRDWLSGQGWFDLMQYRLGLEGGTPMHWSRLVDAPIGGLIVLFSVLMPVFVAEGVAASIWPLLLCGPLLLGLGLAGQRMGGPRTMHIALGLGMLFIFTCSKFRPGALDHHNVQLVLAIGLAALLADRRGRALGHAAAGLVAALAIAVGAETVPFVAAACICVATRWIWQGRDFASAARAFGLSLALSITAIFLATVPPRAYAMVTCDNLSLGFYSLAALGGTGLFGLACLPYRSGLALRLSASGALGVVLAAAALVIAPECLGSPLAGLDPMLVDLWLSAVSEARSITQQMRIAPHSVAGYYVVGLGAMIVCSARIWRGEDRGIHLLFLVLIAATWAVSLIQVRGMFFANLLAIPPLALLIADLQQKARDNPKSIGTAVAFIAVALASVPAVWAVAGAAWKLGITSVNINVLSMEDRGEGGECGNAADMKMLASFTPGVVAAPSNSGADILRFTPHRVLSAPYHRNQGGMLTELHIGISTPSEAEAFLRGAHVSVVAFCASDPQTASLTRVNGEGLYAALARGDVPSYLRAVPNEDGRFRLFEVIAEPAR